MPKELLKEHANILSWIAKTIDVLLFLFAGILAFYVRFHNLFFIDLYWVALLLAALFIVPIFSFFNVYTSIRGRSLFLHLKDLYLGLFFLMLILVAVSFFTKTGPFFSRAWFLMWALFAVALLTGFRLFLRYLLFAMRRKGWNQKQVLIIGTYQIRADLIERIKNNICSGFNVKEAIDSEDIPANLGEYVEKYKIDEIWLGFFLKDEEKVKNVIQNLRHNVVTIRYFPDIFGISLLSYSTTTEILGLPAINIISSPMIGSNRVVKATEDFLGAFIILIVISPILILISLSIKISSRGKIFYKQWRNGWDGKPILIYKFRTMIEHDETDVEQAKKNDKRITKIGHFLRRTSLDELPQFINVLQGKMSIVGPRPHAIVHNDMYKCLIPDKCICNATT